MFPFVYVLFVIPLKIRFCCSSHPSARDQDQSKQAKEVNEVVVYSSQGKGYACSYLESLGHKKDVLKELHVQAAFLRKNTVGKGKKTETFLSGESITNVRKRRKERRNPQFTERNRT